MGLDCIPYPNVLHASTRVLASLRVALRPYDSAMNDKDFPFGLPQDPSHSFLSNGNTAGLSSFWNMDDGLDQTRPIPISDAPPEEGLLLPSGYRLRNIVGRGGFGEVWSAEQTSLCRVVAVKRLHRSKLYGQADSGTARALLAEFRKEAITSANLEHPNIVPVHDIVMDEAGEPLLCMKLIQGQTWNRLIDADLVKLSIEDHLARHIPILIAVAQAVAFAHSRGVMHRDLKPAQVIIGEYGEVVLGDWGLAVAFDTETLGLHSGNGAQSQVPSKVEATNPGGTAAYMAPEQTKATCDGLGPWTDIYLLGGTIFTILTGLAPHHAATGTRAFEMASRGEIAPLDSGVRKEEFPEELVALMYRALEVQPAKRVPSAREFVAALQEFMSGSGRRRESVQLAQGAAEQLALPTVDYSTLSTAEGSLVRALTLWPGNANAKELRAEVIARHGEVALSNADLTLAQLQADRLPDSPRKSKLNADIRAAVNATNEKENQRRKLQRSLRLSGAAFVLMSAILGGLAFRSALRADAEAARALERAQEATHQREVADAERTRANARATEAREARDRAEDLVNFLVVDLQDSLAPLGRTSLMKRVADKSAQYFSQRPSAEMSETELTQYAMSQRNMADIFSTLGDIGQAKAALVKGIEALNGDTASATEERLAFRAGLILRMAGLAQREFDLGALEQSINEAEAIITRLKDENTRRSLVLDLIAHRSTLLQMQGDTPAAIALLREGIALAPRGDGGTRIDPNSQIVSTLNRSLASCYYRIGDLDSAIEAQTRAAELGREAYAARSANENTYLARDLVVSLTGLANMLYVADRKEEALVAFQECLKTSEALAAIDPLNSSAAKDLASIRTRFAIALRDQRQHAEARKQIEESVHALAPFASFPDPDSDLLSELALARSELGAMCAEKGEVELAREQLEEAVVIRQTLAMNPDAGAVEFAAVGDVYRELADFQFAEGQREAALATYQTAQTFLENALKSNQGSIHARRSLSLVRSGQAVMLIDSGDIDGGIVAMRAALKLADEVRADNPKSTFEFTNVSYLNEWLVITLNAARRYAEALQASDYTFALAEEALGEAEPDSEQAYNLVVAKMNRIISTIGLKDFEQAMTILEEARTLVDDQLAAEPADPTFQLLKAALLLYQSRIEVPTIGREEADETCLAALQLIEETDTSDNAVFAGLLQFEAYVHLRRAEDAKRLLPKPDSLAGVDAMLREEINALGLLPE